MHQPSPPSEVLTAAPVTSGRHAVDGPPPLWDLVNVLQDGAVLSDEDGTIVLATRRAADMSGYPAAELVGRPIESLIPGARPQTRYGHRAGGIRAPRFWPSGSADRLIGLHRDGTVFPVEIGFSEVTIAGGRFTLTTMPAGGPRSARRHEPPAPDRRPQLARRRDRGDPRHLVRGPTVTRARLGPWSRPFRGGQGRDHGSRWAKPGPRSPGFACSGPTLPGF
jgi:PAS domain S-box-containing protein